MTSKGLEIWIFIDWERVKTGEDESIICSKNTLRSEDG